jgi:hypothetical protein
MSVFRIEAKFPLYFVNAELFFLYSTLICIIYLVFWGFGEGGAWLWNTGCCL